jgi:glycogen operon protein
VQLSLPELPGLKWYRAIDTAREAPGNILRPDRQSPHRTPACRVASHSIVVFEGR